ncbi:MAG: HNH endonuclease signature motif containing protein [Crenarchaeota archaeon]|nr:HNH endonuclease signature motif containing protein [Thermoproteota archaeon]
MKNILIFSFLAIILISSSVSISNVDAQQGSRDLTAEYCINNWQRDPIQCANYIPEDYDQNKAWYDRQEAEKVRQEAEKVRQEAQKIIQSKQDEQTLREIVIGIGIFVFIIIIVVIIARKKKSGSTETQDYRDVKRKDFSDKTKEAVKTNQLGQCNKCGIYPTHWAFDHIAGRGDNTIENCQGLCLDCHEDKTLRDRKRYENKDMKNNDT